MTVTRLQSFFFRLDHLTLPGILTWGDLDSKCSGNVQKSCPNSYRYQQQRYVGIQSNYWTNILFFNRALKNESTRFWNAWHNYGLIRVATMWKSLVWLRCSWRVFAFRTRGSLQSLLVNRMSDNLGENLYPFSLKNHSTNGVRVMHHLMVLLLAYRWCYCWCWIPATLSGQLFSGISGKHRCWLAVCKYGGSLPTAFTRLSRRATLSSVSLQSSGGYPCRKVERTSLADRTLRKEMPHRADGSWLTQDDRSQMSITLYDAHFM